MNTDKVRQQFLDEQAKTYAAIAANWHNTGICNKRAGSTCYISLEGGLENSAEIKTKKD